MPGCIQPGILLYCSRVPMPRSSSARPSSRGFHLKALLLLASAGFARFTVAQTAPDPKQLLKEAIALHQAGKLEEAIQDYRLFLETYPDVPAARSDLGAALAAEGKYEAAIQEYKKALALGPVPQVELNLGLAYYKTAELREAIQAFQRAHEGLPADSRPLLLEADCYLRLGENKKVIELLNPLEQQNRDDLALSYML